LDQEQIPYIASRYKRVNHIERTKPYYKQKKKKTYKEIKEKIERKKKYMDKMKYNKGSQQSRENNRQKIHYAANSNRKKADCVLAKNRREGGVRSHRREDA
jgi:hypothetical protein